MKTNLTTQMKDLLEDYTDEVMHAVEDALLEVAEDSRDELRDRADQIGGFENRTGKYRKSWKVTQEKHRTYTETIVHAKGPEYRRTHLLEFGHKVRNNNDRSTRAFPHISTINEHAQEDAIKKITEAIEKIQ